MSVLISLLVALPGCVAIMIVKGWQLHRQLCEGSYSWKNFAFLSIFWAVITFPFVVSACNGIACGWSLRFGWWLGLIRQLPLFDKLDPTTLIVAVMLGYVVLTVYFFAHCLSWVFYAARRLVRLAA